MVFGWYQYYYWLLCHAYNLLETKQHLSQTLQFKNDEMESITFKTFATPWKRKNQGKTLLSSHRGINCSHQLPCQLEWRYIHSSIVFCDKFLVNHSSVNLNCISDIDVFVVLRLTVFVICDFFFGCPAEGRG